MSMKQKNNGTTSLITKNEKDINDPVSIINSFNKFFTSFAEIFHSKINFSNKSDRNFLLSEINDSLIITCKNEEEIYKIISSLNTNKSCGPNSILTKVLHLLQDQISNNLATNCNLSFSTGVFPAVLNTTKVISILKKNYMQILCKFFMKHKFPIINSLDSEKDFWTNHAILTFLECV